VWSELLGREAQLRTRRVFKELETLLLEVRSVALGAEAGSSGGRDSLSATGVVWEACDSLAELNTLGVAGLAVQKAEQWRDTIKDAIEELQEWADGADLETEGQNDALFDSEDEGVAGDDNDSLNDLFNAANSMPADRPELKELVERAVEKLKKVDILYRALVKRRLKTYKSVAAVEGKKSSAERVDELLENLRSLPDSIDDMASNFYDLDEEAAKAALDDCVKKACEAARLAKLDYNEKEDEFSTWSKKWVEAVGP
jgi:IS4 transposase